MQNVPPQMKAAAANEMLFRAHAADKFVKRTGTAHAVWGNGSLMASALNWPRQTEPFPSNLEYLDSLRLVIEKLIVWKKAQAALNSSCAAMDLC
ncbi:hypothetical protein ACEN2J_02260 [Pseudorhodobacter sp. W20_MBD10_FR17]